MQFFGYRSTAAFTAEWRQMPDADREAIQQGLDDGTLTY
jgi:hypothetical protein